MFVVLVSASCFFSRLWPCSFCIVSACTLSSRTHSRVQQPTEIPPPPLARAKKNPFFQVPPPLSSGKQETGKEKRPGPHIQQTTVGTLPSPKRLLHHSIHPLSGCTGFRMGQWRLARWPSAGPMAAQPERSTPRKLLFSFSSQSRRPRAQCTPLGWDRRLARWPSPGPMAARQERSPPRQFLFKCVNTKPLLSSPAKQADTAGSGAPHHPQQEASKQATRSSNKQRAAATGSKQQQATAGQRQTLSVLQV